MVPSFDPRADYIFIKESVIGMRTLVISLIKINEKLVIPIEAIFIMFSK